MANDYDFQINDLLFRSAISDDYPYQRATAPFRKEQFDSAPTVGDQSLTGWWTRGQLSFHKGAGLKYYEVLDGETILNRYQDARGVKVSTPGQVTLNRDLLNVTSTSITGGVDGVATIPWSQNSYTSTSGVYYLEDNAFKFVAYPIGPTKAAVTVATVGQPGSTACSITGDGKGSVWILTGGGANIESARGAGATAVRYTHTSQMRSIAYAKGRLWVLDTSGRLYAEAPSTAGGSAAIGNLVGTFSSDENGDMRVMESPSGVYISVANNRIYYVTVGNDGTIPTLTAPTVAAELPTGEVVTAIRYYLGNLVAVTAAGFRVADVQADGGLLFGPLLKELDYDSYCNTIATAGTSTFFVQQSTKGVGLKASVYELDLAQPVGDIPGSYAWTEYEQYETSLTSFADYAGVEGVYGGFLVWGKKTLKYTSSSRLLPSGYVTTGYHRFGTLDPKAFQTVSVRCGGTGGSITVSRVDADGKVTSLGALTPSDAAKDFSIGLTDATERIALKFTLTRDATDATKGPELLGYQLKALPVPERQRLLKWPLALVDVFNLRTGRKVGKKGRAYADLVALEALESSNAVITFTDHRTGETGSAYIDSVEFQTHTPPTQTTNGFGGIGYVSLRVLS